MDRRYDHEQPCKWPAAEPPSRVNLPSELREELDRRLSAYRANPSNVLTWEQIMAHLGRPR